METTTFRRVGMFESPLVQVRDSLAGSIRQYLEQQPELGNLLGVGWRVSFLGQGAGSWAYRIRTLDRNLVLKIAKQALHRPTLVDQVRAEVQILEYLHDQAITPKLYWADYQGGCLGRPLVVMDYLPGERLRYSQGQLVLAAQLYARLHQLSGPAQIPHVKAPIAQYCSEGVAWSAVYYGWAGADLSVCRELELAQGRLEAMHPDYSPPVLTHGDATYENWRFWQHQGRIFDWDWCRVTTPAADLAHFLSPVTTRRYRDRLLSRDEEQLFLKAYGLKGFTEELRQVRAAVVFHSLAWTARQVVQLTDDPQAPDYLQKSRILTQIEPDFLSWLRREEIW